MEELEVFAIPPAEKTLWYRCESLVYRIFLESGYVEARPSKRIDIFDCYASMEFLAAFAGDRQLPLEQRILSGVVRLIYAPQARTMGPGLFLTIDHAEELEIAPGNLKTVLAMDPRRCFDVASMAISKEKRNNGKIFNALSTAAMLRVCERPRLRHGFTIMDTDFSRKLKGRGLPFGDLGPSVMYMGSMSTAAMIDASRAPRRLQGPLIPLLKLLGQSRSSVSGDRDL